jgi:hypothetical protein
MTPERLAELRAWMAREETTTDFCLRRADLVALLDRIESQEKALQAADDMAETLEGASECVSPDTADTYRELRAETKR